MARWAVNDGLGCGERGRGGEGACGFSWAWSSSACHTQEGRGRDYAGEKPKCPHGVGRGDEDTS